MAITFTRAVTVEAGDPITSTEYAKLAAAFNDRLRSGLGDPTWRICYYFLALFRQMRNPADELYPPMAEFFELYQHLEPESGTWPTAPEGMAEGANLANFMNAFVFGAEALDLASEELRLFGEEGIPLLACSTLAEAWNLGKLQRGGYDPVTGGLGSPAFTAARSYAAIRASPQSMHGNAYGGYLPTPELGDACEDPDPADEFEAPRNYLYKFTALVEGLSDVAYDGSCQPAVVEQYPTHVAGIAYTPWAYVVFLNDGTVDVLLKSQYMEGPYTGEAKLTKTHGAHLPRVLNAFAREFRGSDVQRAASSYHVQRAFDFQRFLSGQYHLAPNYGFTVDNSVVVVYPQFRFAGGVSLAAGTLATYMQGGGSSYAYHDGFVVAGLYASATKLATAVTVEVLDGEDVLTWFTLEPGVGNTAEALVMVEPASTPSALKFRLKYGAQFTAADGQIDIEANELYAYQPEVHDLYLVLRAGGARWDASTDGRGIDEEQAREIGQDYWQYGCILNRRGATSLPPALGVVNTNAVYDAARRLSHCVRMIPRRQFVGYAVEDGVSILWMKRWAFGMSGTAPVDLFAGIAPGRLQVASGALRRGRSYEVRSGSVNYDGQDYHAGEHFTADGSAGFSGAGAVYEYDGIRHEADYGGETNEWMLGVQFKAYNLSESSLWKPSAYADYFPLVNRCHYYAPDIAYDPKMTWHVNYGQRVSGGPSGGVLSPESPSGYNYAPLTLQLFGTHVNSVDCGGDPTCEAWRLNFYKSCRIYEPDVEIDSAIVIEENGEEIVKLTLTGRVHHCDTAPSSVDRDYTTWNAATIAAEPFRSTENGLREYILHNFTGTDCTAGGLAPWEGGGPTGQPGNAAAHSGVQSGGDAPFGSCYPTFLLTKLVPAPYEDENDTQQSHDTPIRHDAFLQMELYLRAMCEGYVDGRTSTDYACEHSTSTLFDYSFENLCYDAFGGRWFRFLTDALRPDLPQGFGPTPNTFCYAEVFNQFAQAVNCLDKVRVMLPMKLMCAEETNDSEQEVNACNADGTLYGGCTPAGDIAVWAECTPPDPSPSFASPVWNEGGCLTSPAAQVQANLDCRDSVFKVVTTRRSVRLAWDYIDPDAMYAIPDEWRAMVTDDPLFLCKLTDKRWEMRREIVTNINDSSECCYEYQKPCPGHWQIDAGHWLRFYYDTVESTSCELMTDEIEADAIGLNSFPYGHTADDMVCQDGPNNELYVEIITDNATMVQVPLTY